MIKKAVSARGNRSDLADARGHASAIAGKIQKSRLAGFRWLVPGNELRPVGRLENDLFERREPDLFWVNPLRIGNVNEVTMEQSCDDAKQYENSQKS